MAQAARLNLRMQKELKLLLTDPPPNASFPSLSDDSSLTSIDAHLRGPDGTVYADGVFKIKIKIPERYPFQPPVVTFGTRVYHPNIDDGGRICLDILNLPPKGSWQPSLNISTVLTSIGLLLSEPNPDDGLMHDASREYKYNREVFDQKARSMTEKYARVGESESATSGHDTEAHTGPSTVKTESEGSDAPECSTEHFKRQKRFSGSSRKLSLESFGSSSNKDNDKGIYKVPNHDYLKNHAETRLPKEAEIVVTELSRNPNKVQVPRHKLSLKVSGLSHSGNGQSTKTNMENHCSSLLENQTPSSDSPDSSSLVPAGHNHELVSCRDEDNTESCSMSFNQEEKLLESVKANMRSEDSGEKLHHMPQHAVSQLDSAKSRQALPRPLITSRNSNNPPKDAIDRIESGSTRHHLEDKKEYLAPNEHLLPKPADQSGTSCMVPSIVSENHKYYNERTGKQGLNVVKKQLGLVSKLPRKPLNQLPDSNKKLKLHTENFLSSHSQFLHERIDVRPDVKQQTNQGHDGESIDKLKQPSGGSPIPEVAIVLDSEDSEEENVPVRSKLSLARKCLSRKPKLNV